MTEPMKPADVPDEILLAFSDAEAHCWGNPVHGLRYAECCRRAGLAAVLPLIEQQVREQIAVRLDGIGKSIARGRPATGEQQVVTRVQADTYATAAWLTRNPDQGGDHG